MIAMIFVFLANWFFLYSCGMCVFLFIGVLDIFFDINFEFNWEKYWPYISLLVMFTSAGVGLTRIGDIFFRFVLVARRPVRNEKILLDSAVGEIVKRIKSKKKSLPNYKFYIIDSPFPETFTLGSETILLTKGFLKSSSEQELRSIIAYELSKLICKDSSHISILVSLNLPIFFVRKFSNVLLNYYGELFRSDPVTFLFAAALSVPLFIFAMLALIYEIFVNTIGVFITSSSVTYKTLRSDEFVVDLGYEEGLLSYLNKIYEMNITQNSIWQQVTGLAPAPAIGRISEIENR